VQDRSDQQSPASSVTPLSLILTSQSLMIVAFVAEGLDYNGMHLHYKFHSVRWQVQHISQCAEGLGKVRNSITHKLAANAKNTEDG
jgi:hypothetical protein